MTTSRTSVAAARGAIAPVNVTANPVTSVPGTSGVSPGARVTVVVEPSARWSTRSADSAPSGHENVLKPPSTTPPVK
ncbi:Uncharacterised protein [Mycobacteroides abscessus]|nr:Uncharacterised protein [Mycobacteroides abscessus]